MPTFLDTNIVIGVINGRVPGLRDRLRREIRDGGQIVISAVILFELRYGIARSQRREQSELLLHEFLAHGIEAMPFEADDAAHAADIRTHLESFGTPVCHYDYLIAGHARRHRATLVTLNMREFSRVPGLRVTDWA